MKKTGIDKLDYYTSGVASGEIDACKWVRLAVERHYRDLDRWGINDYNPESEQYDRKPIKDAPCYFSKKSLTHYVSFFEENLKHYDGIFAGKPFIFEPWQYFAFGSPFAWINYERIAGMAIRRFSEVIVIVPKKQGKSIWIAGTKLFMLEYDNYPGAQIYALAINQSHAKTLGYRDAEILVANSSELKEKYKVNKGAATIGIYYPENNSHIKPLVSNEQIADGPKIHMAANDEIKDWKNFNLYNTLVNGTATDPNAIIVNITTAGHDKTSLGYERQNYAQQILEQKIEDEETFGIIYGIDEGDEKKWDKEEIWKKANPNYGISVGKKYYEKRVRKAKNSQAGKNDFLTFHLNEWVDSLSGWLNMEYWDRCGDKNLTIDQVKDYDCVLSFDVASKIDLVAAGLTFFKGGECWDFCNFYLPEDALKDDKKYDDSMKSQVMRWAEAGHLILTPGNTFDQNILMDFVKEAFKKYNVVDLPYDPWNAAKLVNDLQRDGIDIEIMTEYGQAGYKQWTEPMKETERLILEGKLHHPGNPVMRWNMGNVVTRTDNNDNIRPLKELPQNKIDGAVRLFMGISRGMVHFQDEQSNPYDERGMIFI